MTTDHEIPWRATAEEQEQIQQAVTGARDVLRNASPQVRTEALFLLVRSAYDGCKFDRTMPGERDSLALVLDAMTHHHDHHVLRVPESLPAHHAFQRRRVVPDEARRVISTEQAQKLMERTRGEQP